MTHRYCLDTSGFSNPFAEMPYEIHRNFWNNIMLKIWSEIFCWNTEIAEEMERINDPIGPELKNHNRSCCYEIGIGNWDWESYQTTIEEWKKEFKQYISERDNNRKDTIGYNDLSIVALAHSLGLPLVSMEKPVSVGPGQQSSKKLRIPDLCERVQVEHYSFNALCKKERISDEPSGDPIGAQ